MNRHTLIVLAVAAVLFLTAFAATSGQPAALRFQAAGTNGFTFDTGILRGQLRPGGRSMGLSSVVHVPTGVRLDSSMGLFSHYRLFSANHRYGTAAWDIASEAALMEDGSVAVNWPAVPDRPFELRAVYRWAAPDTLDLETSVRARTNLVKFESFLASYFSECFTNARVYARSNGESSMMAAVRSSGVWQAFPRDEEAVRVIQDGRWKLPPNPVDWVILPPLAKPVAVRCCPANDLQAVLTSPSRDCFAVLTPFEAEPHRSMYLSLFGGNLKVGETARVQARLRIGIGVGAHIESGEYH